MYMCVCLKKHHICNEFLKYRTIHIKLLTMIIKKCNWWDRVEGHGNKGVFSYFSLYTLKYIICVYSVLFDLFLQQYVLLCNVVLLFKLIVSIFLVNGTCELNIQMKNKNL